MVSRQRALLEVPARTYPIGMAIRETLRGYAADTGRAFNRAPLECALSVFSAACMSATMEQHQGSPELVHAVIAAVLIAFIAWGATLLHALGSIRSNTRWIATAAGGAFGIAYLLLTAELEHESEGWRALMIVLGIVLLVLSVPAWKRQPRDASLYLRRINGRVLLRTAGIALYGLALFAGLAVALAAVDNLFELHLRGEIYGHTFFWIMLVLVPWVIVGGLDDYVQPVAEVSEVSRVVHRLAGFLVPPLVAIYFAILCAYALRIAITHELPQNLVSPMVIAAGLLAGLALVVFDPPADASLGRRWLRFTPFVFVPLAPLGLWAILSRVDEYGWTEFRLLRLVVLAALAALAVPSLLFVARRRPLPLPVIPMLLGAALLLGAIGPWSVIATARRSQQHRLAAALESAGIDASAPFPADSSSRKIAPEVYERVSGSYWYLSSHFGAAAVTDVVPAYTDASQTDGLIARYHLTADRVDGKGEPDYEGGELRPGAQIVTERGTARRVRVPSRGGPAAGWIVGDSVFTVAGADTLSAGLLPALQALRQADPRGGNASLDATAAPVMDRKGAVRGTLMVLEISRSMQKGVRKITSLDAVMMLWH
jgi:hypothetical protein